MLKFQLEIRFFFRFQNDDLRNKKKVAKNKEIQNVLIVVSITFKFTRYDMQK